MRDTVCHCTPFDFLNLATFEVPKSESAVRGSSMITDTKFFRTKHSILLMLLHFKSARFSDLDITLRTLNVLNVFLKIIVAYSTIYTS